MGYRKILKDDGTPYRVFTPFYKKGCLVSGDPRPPLPDLTPNVFQTELLISELSVLSELIDDDWDKKIKKNWDVGESNTLNQLDAFFCKMESITTKTAEISLII